MTDLVDQMIPPLHRKAARGFTDLHYLTPPIHDFELPNLDPPSPALSARSDASRLSRLGLPRFGLRGKGSNQSLAERVVKPSETPRGAAPRASSPLSSPVLTANDPDEDAIAEYMDSPHSDLPTGESDLRRGVPRPTYGGHLDVPDDFHLEPRTEGEDEGEEHREDEDPEDQAFDDDLLA